MSRCFPYPPPGYEKNGIRDEALVESIKKLQREGEKAKKDKKKEKKREKKGKGKARENGDAGKEKHGHKKRHKDERCQEGKKEGDNGKKRKLETENVEKSNLTEEHGQPVGSQNSSDSTLNSNKRHKPCSPPESCHNSGSIIRIRLPLQRHKDPEILPNKEQPCSASGRTHNAFAQGTCEPALRQGREEGEHLCSTSTRNASQEVKNFRLSKEKHCPTTNFVNLSHKVESVAMPSTSSQLSKEHLSSAKKSIAHPSKEKHCPTTKSVEISNRAASVPSKEKHCPTTKSIEISHRAASVPSKEKHCPTTKSVEISHRAASVPSKEKHCPTTKSVEISHRAASVPSKEKHCPTTKSVEISHRAASVPSKEKHCPTTKSVELSHEAASVPMPNASTHCPPPPIVSQFRDLFENWVPLPTQGDCTGYSDETWLFESKQNHNKGIEKWKDENDILSYEPSTLWPRAHFLPTADVFALPYAALF